jgi:hypothetical protein
MEVTNEALMCLRQLCQYLQISPPEFENCVEESGGRGRGEGFDCSVLDEKSTFPLKDFTER